MARQDGNLIARNEYTIAAWCRHVIDNVIAPVRERSTVRNYLDILNAYIAPYLGNTPLQKLQPADVERWYSALRKAGKSPRTVQAAHSILHRCLQHAVRQGKVVANAASKDKVERPSIGKRRPKFLTPKQADAFLRAAAGDRLFPLWVVMLDSGIRLQEALALRWQDVAAEKCQIRVERALKRDGGEYYIGQPKNDTSARVFAVSSETMATLEKWREAQRVEMKALGFITELVFADEIGNVLNPDRARRHFRAVLELAGLPTNTGLTPHKLRHSHATELIAAGVPVTEVARRLGHSTSVTTLSVYSHAFDAQDQEAVDRLAAYRAARRKAR